MASLASLKRTLLRRAIKRTTKRFKRDAAVTLVQPDSERSDIDDVPVYDEGTVEDCVPLIGASVQDDSDIGAEENLEGDGDSESEGHIVSDGISASSMCSNVSADDVASNSDNDDRPILGTEAEKEQYVNDSVRAWALQPGLLSMTKLDDLLHRLSHVFPRMPLTYTTLFQCDYNFDIADLPSGGTMWYKGLLCNLGKLDMKAYLEQFNKIILDVGVDGLPTVGAKLWPILGHLVGTDDYPFIIGVYRGHSDPTNIDEFLGKYCAELQNLLRDGFTFDGEVYEVQVRYYICDAPARAFLKSVIRYNGYEGCEKCTVLGEWRHNRVIFLDLDCALRTDQSFQQSGKSNSPCWNITFGSPWDRDGNTVPS